MIDPRLTFENFIVGTSNRLAAGAAKRVAGSPGQTYNPLFVHAPSGLGKTHLLMAIGNQAAREGDDLHVMYDTLERLMDSVMTAIEAGERDAFRTRVRDAGMLLLDDVQFLAGRRSVQEELLRAWDAFVANGGQVVLASDRPPSEIDGLDERLLSRFSEGLIADLGPPDYETRVAIVRRKSEERGQSLSPGVAEVLARAALENVRELQGRLNRVLAGQELDGRPLSAEEVARLLGVPVPPDDSPEFREFLADIAGTVDELVDKLDAGLPQEGDREEFPEPPAGPRLEDLALDPGSFVVRAARAVLDEPGERYSPFVVHGGADAGKTTLLLALAHALKDGHPGLRVAYVEGREFTASLIEAIEQGRLDAWRVRYRSADALLLDDVDELTATERAQEELFHLFDALRSTGAQLVFSASAPPRALEGVEPRLRTRLESGLVVDLAEAVPAKEAAPGEAVDEWFLNREKVLWNWPYLEEWLEGDAH